MEGKGGKKDNSGGTVGCSSQGKQLGSGDSKMLQRRGRQRRGNPEGKKERKVQNPGSVGRLVGMGD